MTVGEEEARAERANDRGLGEKEDAKPHPAVIMLVRVLKDILEFVLLEEDSLYTVEHREKGRVCTWAIDCQNIVVEEQYRRLETGLGENLCGGSMSSIWR